MAENNINQQNNWRQKIYEMMRDSGYNDLEARKVIRNIIKECSLDNGGDLNYIIEVDQEIYNNPSFEYFGKLMDIENRHIDVVGNTSRQENDENGRLTTVKDYPLDEKSGIVVITDSEIGIQLQFSFYNPPEIIKEKYAGHTFLEIAQDKREQIEQHILENLIHMDMEPPKARKMMKIMVTDEMLCNIVENNYTIECFQTSDPLKYAYQSLDKTLICRNENGTPFFLEETLLVDNFEERGKIGNTDVDMGMNFMSLPEFRLDIEDCCLVKSIDDQGNQVYKIFVYNGKNYKQGTFLEYMEEVLEDELNPKTKEVCEILSEKYQTNIDEAYIRFLLEMLGEQAFLDVKKDVKTYLGLSADFSSIYEDMYDVTKDPQAFEERLYNTIIEEKRGQDVARIEEISIELLTAAWQLKLGKIVDIPTDFGENVRLVNRPDFNLLEATAIRVVGHSINSDIDEENKEEYDQITIYMPSDEIIAEAKKLGFNEIYMFSDYAKHHNIEREETEAHSKNLQSVIDNLVEANNTLVSYMHSLVTSEIEGRDNAKKENNGVLVERNRESSQVKPSLPDNIIPFRIKVQESQQEKKVQEVLNSLNKEVTNSNESYTIEGNDIAKKTMAKMVRDIIELEKKFLIEADNMEVLEPHNLLEKLPILKSKVIPEDTQQQKIEDGIMLLLQEVGIPTYIQTQAVAKVNIKAIQQTISLIDGCEDEETRNAMIGFKYVLLYENMLSTPTEPIFISEKDFKEGVSNCLTDMAIDVLLDSELSDDIPNQFSLQKMAILDVLTSEEIERVTTTLQNMPQSNMRNRALEELDNSRGNKELE
jgi:hypothetical protein